MIFLRFEPLCLFLFLITRSVGWNGNDEKSASNIRVVANFSNIKSDLVYDAYNNIIEFVFFI